MVRKGATLMPSKIRLSATACSVKSNPTDATHRPPALISSSPAADSSAAAACRSHAYGKFICSGRSREPLADVAIRAPLSLAPLAAA